MPLTAQEPWKTPLSPSSHSEQGIHFLETKVTEPGCCDSGREQRETRTLCGDSMVYQPISLRPGEGSAVGPGSPHPVPPHPGALLHPRTGAIQCLPECFQGQGTPCPHRIPC